MQVATLTIPVGNHDQGDSFRVMGNVDQYGRATGSVDQVVSGEASRPYWPLGAIGADSGWKIDAWKDSDWKGGDTGPDDLVVETPALYFGNYAFAVVAIDAAGNENDDGTQMAVTVNSGPQMLTEFKRIDTEDNSLRFGYTRPPQWV